MWPGTGSPCLPQLLPSPHPSDPAHRENTVKGDNGGEEKGFLSSSHGLWDEGVVSRKETLFAYLWTYGRVRGERSDNSLAHPSLTRTEATSSLPKSTDVVKESLSKKQTCRLSLTFHLCVIQMSGYTHSLRGTSDVWGCTFSRSERSYDKEKNSKSRYLAGQNIPVLFVSLEFAASYGSGSQKHWLSFLCNNDFGLQWELQAAESVVTPS